MKKTMLAMALLTILFAAAPLAAQKRIQVTPFYGYVYPQNELPETFALNRTAGGSLDIAQAKLEERTSFIGATIALRLYKGVNIEGTYMQGTDKMVAFQREETDVDISSLSGGLSLELPKLWLAEPYLLAGVGVKKYDFDIEGTDPERDREFNFGAGVNVPLFSRLALNLQAKSLVSKFNSSLYDVESENQNDILLAGGLTFTFGQSHGHVASLTR